MSFPSHQGASSPLFQHAESVALNMLQKKKRVAVLLTERPDAFAPESAPLLEAPLPETVLSPILKQKYYYENSFICRIRTAHLDRPDVSGTTKTDPVKTILSPALALSTTSFLVFNTNAVSER